MGEDRARQPYCHTVLGLIFLLPQGGNAVRFFLFVFFLSGPVSFVVFCRSSPLRVVFGKIFGSELLFLGGCVGLVFFGRFLLLFLLYFLAFRSRNCLEKFY